MKNDRNKNKEHVPTWNYQAVHLHGKIYFSKENQAKSKSIKALQSIEGGEDPNLFGDPFLLGKNFSSKTVRELQRSFGDQFSQYIQDLEVKKSSGPISSEYGEHLIFLNSYKHFYIFLNL